MGGTTAVLFCQTLQLPMADPFDEYILLTKRRDGTFAMKARSADEAGLEFRCCSCVFTSVRGFFQALDLAAATWPGVATIGRPTTRSGSFFPGSRLSTPIWRRASARYSTQGNVRSTPPCGTRCTPHPPDTRRGRRGRCQR